MKTETELEKLEAEIQLVVDDFYPKLVKRVSKYATRYANYITPEVKIVNHRNVHNFDKALEARVDYEWDFINRQGLKEDVAKRVLGDSYENWLKSRESLPVGAFGQAKGHENRINVSTRGLSWSVIIHELLHRLRAQTVPYEEAASFHSILSLYPRMNVDSRGFMVNIPVYVQEFFSQMGGIIGKDVLGEDDEIAQQVPEVLLPEPEDWQQKGIPQDPKSKIYIVPLYAIYNIESNLRSIRKNWPKIFAMSPQEVEWRYLLKAEARVEAVNSKSPNLTRLRYAGKRVLAFCQDLLCDYYTHKHRPTKSFTDHWGY